MRRKLPIWELTVIPHSLDLNSRIQRRCCPPYLLFKKIKSGPRIFLFFFLPHAIFKCTVTPVHVNKDCEPLRLPVPIRVPCDKFIILCLISGSTVRLMFYLLSQSTALLYKPYLTQTEDCKTKGVLALWDLAQSPACRSSSPPVEQSPRSSPYALTPSPLSSNLLQVEESPL